MNMHSNITLVMNSGSGHDDKTSARDLIVQKLGEAGITVKVAEISGGNIVAVCNAAAKEAKQSGSLVVAAGGDGTVNCVASACVKHDVPMGVIPMGTYNYFARDLGIANDIEGAIAVLATGQLRTTSVGLLQDQVFVNNASFGTYARIVRNRELDKKKFGRYRIVALLSDIRSLYAPAKNYTLRIGADDMAKNCRTTMIFASINKFQMENLGIPAAEKAGREQMSITIMKPVSRLQMTRILLRGLCRQLPQDERIDVLYAESFTVDAPAAPIACVVDGEIVHLTLPLEFKLLPDQLRVMAPAPQVPA
ncbi:MAG: diacylglycerol kinase family protein [bacterium]|nr:diacylglycerol kinase family protein [bacterium]